MSVETCDILNKRSTEVVGTLRCDRKGVTGKKILANERIIMYEHHLSCSNLLEG